MRKDMGVLVWTCGNCGVDEYEYITPEEASQMKNREVFYGGRTCECGEIIELAKAFDEEGCEIRL